MRLGNNPQSLVKVGDRCVVFGRHRWRERTEATVKSGRISLWQKQRSWKKNVIWGEKMMWHFGRGE